MNWLFNFPKSIHSKEKVNERVYKYTANPKG